MALGKVLDSSAPQASHLDNGYNQMFLEGCQEDGRGR